MLVSGGGYEDMKFQAELCTAVSLKGILEITAIKPDWLMGVLQKQSIFFFMKSM